MKQFIFFIFLFASALANASQKDLEGPHLQAALTAVAVQPGKDPEKIQCGTPVKLCAKVKNVGTETTAAGTIYIRYAFLEPFHQYEQSVIFQTEKLSLPSICPGDEVELSFAQQHNVPCIFEYIREDWPMRQYEARVAIGGKEETIGRVALSVSAHYYQGPAHLIPKQVKGL